MSAMFNGAAPLPVPSGEAVAVARYLRERYRFSYRDLEKIMALYHDQWYAAETWRFKLRRAGVPGDRCRDGSARGFARDDAA